MSAEIINFVPRQEFKEKKIARTFTPEFEMRRAARVDKLSPEARESFLSYELMQMETHLGERFNVNISRFEYEIKNGQLYGKDMDEPFIDSIRLGRDIRRREGSWVDFRREDAEVDGFSKIEKTLVDPEIPAGTMMLSISPPGLEGSSYSHNFTDIHTVREKDGVRYLETRRYASSLSIDEYQEKLSAFTDLEIDRDDPGAFLLANPIAIAGTLTPEDLHSYLQGEHEFMSDDVFNLIKNHCRQLAKEYALSLLNEPGNIKRHGELFNAYINKADEIASRIENEGAVSLQKIAPIGSRIMLEEDIARYGSGPVKQIMTGCGMSGGYETSSKKETSAFGVVDHGFDRFGKRSFKCPECDEVNVRPYNELLALCQHCKSTKVAC